MARRKQPTWAEYVESVVAHEKSYADAARHVGLDPATISRWVNGNGQITSRTVAIFARGYDLSVLEAFVIAGFLTRREAGMTQAHFVEWEHVSDEAFAEEARRRLLRSNPVPDGPKQRGT